jgi:uncharacterized protein
MALRFLLCSLLSLAALPAFGGITYPTRPVEGAFIADEASLLSPEAAAEIKSIASSLQSDTGIPLIVVTITSLQAHGAAGLTIEAYAMSLFNTWGIGHEKRNRGLLLLVSEGDRQARIELGADWGAGEHADSRQVMDGLIVPQFREGNMSGGILAGVRGLDAMARGLELPKPKPNAGAIVLQIAIFVGIIAVIISLFKSGRSGWGWALIAALAIGIFFAMRSAARNSGGGFGGGSFGGGFSGGGGATGSW